MMAIDPRIRARRVQVRRAEGRRRLRFLLGALTLVGLAIAAWGLSRSPLLDVDHVRLEGVEGADARTVEDVAAIETGTAMFDLDLGRVEQDIERLPWVADAAAERDWPGTVRLVVETRVAVAQIGLSAEDAVLADRDGVLLRERADDRLPRVAVAPSVALGEIDPQAVAGIGVALAIPDDLLVWVEAVTVEAGEGTAPDSRPGLGLDLLGSASVRLGTIEFIDDKLDAVRAVLEGVQLECIDVIDVVVADFPTTTRRDGCDDPGAVTDGSTDA